MLITFKVQRVNANVCRPIYLQRLAEISHLSFMFYFVEQCSANLVCHACGNLSATAVPLFILCPTSPLGRTAVKCKLKIRQE